MGCFSGFGPNFEAKPEGRFTKSLIKLCASFIESSGFLRNLCRSSVGRQLRLANLERRPLTVTIRSLDPRLSL